MFFSILAEKHFSRVLFVVFGQRDVLLALRARVTLVFALFRGLKRRMINSAYLSGAVVDKLVW